jgi:hypothetical protein
MNSSTSGWLVLTRNFVAGSHPQNDTAKRGRPRYLTQLKGAPPGINIGPAEAEKLRKGYWQHAHLEQSRDWHCHIPGSRDAVAHLPLQQREQFRVF